MDCQVEPTSRCTSKTQMSIGPLSNLSTTRRPSLKAQRWGPTSSKSLQMTKTEVQSLAMFYTL